MQLLPETRYAQNGTANIAYQVVGDGDLDILLVDTWVHHVEAVWDVPEFARFLRKLSALGRLIHFDRRGAGLSDPVSVEALPDLGMLVDDAIAVLRAAGSRSAAVIGLNDGTIVASMLAAAHPEICRALVLLGFTRRHAFPPGLPVNTIDEVVELIEASALTGDSGVDFLAPSRAADERFRRDLSRLQRFAVRPGVMGHYYRQTMEADVSDVLPEIGVPTLVLNREDNFIVTAEQSRDAAAAIEGARCVILPGTDHLAFSQGIDELVGEIEEFLTGTRSFADPDRVLASLLFTDICDSTTLAAEMGDRRWRDVLDRHNTLMRAQLSRYGGREIGTTGDGFFAAFDRPLSAVRCAIESSAAVASVGLRIRAGVHVGEVEVRGEDLGGLAVHIAARIASTAQPGEVLVSSTVRDLLVGSDPSLDDRGEHELKGVPGTWRLFSAKTPR